MRRPLVVIAVGVMTAAQGQLGLKLEGARGPVDVIIIDPSTGRRWTDQPRV